MSYKFECKLKEVIASCKDGVDRNDISLNSNMVNDFGFDSINMVQMIIAIETEFEIIIDDNDLLIERLSSYNNLVEIVAAKLK